MPENTQIKVIPKVSTDHPHQEPHILDITVCFCEVGYNDSSYYSKFCSTYEYLLAAPACHTAFAYTRVEPDCVLMTSAGTGREM